MTKTTKQQISALIYSERRALWYAKQMPWSHPVLKIRAIHDWYLISKWVKNEKKGIVKL